MLPAFCWSWATTNPWWSCLQTGKTSAEAAAGLGCEVAQIAKSIIFRRAADNAPVLVIASGTNRVDEAKVSRRWARWPRPTPSSCAT